MATYPVKTKPKTSWKDKLTQFANKVGEALGNAKFGD